MFYFLRTRLTKEAYCIDLRDSLHYCYHHTLEHFPGYKGASEDDEKLYGKDSCELGEFTFDGDGVSGAHTHLLPMRNMEDYDAQLHERKIGFSLSDYHAQDILKTSTLLMLDIKDPSIDRAGIAFVLMDYAHDPESYNALHNNGKMLPLCSKSKKISEYQNKETEMLTLLVKRIKNMNLFHIGSNAPAPRNKRNSVVSTLSQNMRNLFGLLGSSNILAFAPHSLIRVQLSFVSFVCKVVEYIYSNPIAKLNVTEYALEGNLDMHQVANKYYSGYQNASYFSTCYIMQYMSNILNINNNKYLLLKIKFRRGCFARIIELSKFTLKHIVSHIPRISFNIFYILSIPILLHSISSHLLGIYFIFQFLRYAYVLLGVNLIINFCISKIKRSQASNALSGQVQYNKIQQAMKTIPQDCKKSLFNTLPEMKEQMNEEYLFYQFYSETRSSNGAADIMKFRVIPFSMLHHVLPNQIIFAQSIDDKIRCMSQIHPESMGTIFNNFGKFVYL